MSCQVGKAKIAGKAGKRAIFKNWDGIFKKSYYALLQKAGKAGKAYITEDLIDVGVLSQLFEMRNFWDIILRW